jgi:hypothetical protein
MFIIASTGRCGTKAICNGLNQFSDHVVEHEPYPRLLREAYLKHKRLDYGTTELDDRLKFFRQQDGKTYGQSFRAPNLLPEIASVVSDVRFLIIVRNPLEYIASAYNKNVFRKRDEFEEYRIMPLKSNWETFPVATKIVLHWKEVNQYLLDFAELYSKITRVVVLNRIEGNIESWAKFLHVRITNREAFERFLVSNPNASITKDLPPDYNRESLIEICEESWMRAQRLAGAI